jgi:hypothetical protein
VAPNGGTPEAGWQIEKDRIFGNGYKSVNLVNLGTPFLIIEQRRKLGMLFPEFRVVASSLPSASSSVSMAISATAKWYCKP